MRTAQFGLVVAHPDLTVPAAYLTVIDAVCANLSLEIYSFVGSTVPVQVSFSVQSLDPGVLASAWPYYLVPKTYMLPSIPTEPTVFADTVYPVSLANKLARRKLITAPNDPTDIKVLITNTPPSGFTFYTGLNGNCLATEIDLYTVLLHELLHGVGFYGTAKINNGQIVYGGRDSTSPNNAPVFKASIFDRFIKNGTSSNAAALTSFPTVTPSSSLDSFLKSPLYFTGAKAVAAATAGQVKIFSPPVFADGSSESHLDGATYLGSADALATNGLGAQEAYHDIGNIVRGVLQDIGWSLNPIMGIEDAAKIVDFNSQQPSPTRFNPGQSISNYYAATFIDNAPSGDTMVSASWTIKLRHSGGEHVILSTAGMVLIGVLPPIPAGFDWLRNTDGSISASLNLEGIDQLGYHHSTYLNIGINKVPESPILKINPYQNCSNTASLEFYSKGATGYHILYGTVSGGPYTHTITVPATQGFYKVSNLKSSATYHYTVNAFNSVGSTSNANQVSQTVANVGDCKIIMAQSGGGGLK